LHPPAASGLIASRGPGAGDPVSAGGSALSAAGALAGAGLNCVTIKADYITIGTATANVYDQNGALTGKNGVAIDDLVPVLLDWGSGTYFGRSDYDQNGSIGVADLIPWLTTWGAGTSADGCTTTYCP